MGNNADIKANEECAYICENDRDFEIPGHRITKHCPQPMKGQYVSVFRETGIQTFRICEVYIEGYQYFG